MAGHPHLSSAKRFGRKWRISIVVSIASAAVVLSIYYLSPVILPHYNELSDFARTLYNAIDALGWITSIGLAIMFERRSGKEALVGGAIGKAQAERTHELDVRERQLVIHRTELLRVFTKWSESSYAHQQFGSYNFGSMSIEKLHWHGSPENEEYYREAREDLECWSQSFTLLTSSESLVNGVNGRAELLQKASTDAIKKLMQHLGVKDWFNGGAEMGKGYYLSNILSFLILRPIAEGKAYKPRFELQKDTIAALGTTGASIGGLVTGIKSSKEADELIQVFTNFGDELNKMEENPSFFSELCNEISTLQSGFLKAEESYNPFLASLKETAIKDLKGGFPILDGGRCPICLRLRA